MKLGPGPAARHPRGFFKIQDGRQLSGKLAHAPDTLLLMCRFSFDGSYKSLNRSPETFALF